MRFLGETAVLAGRRGLTILGFITAVLPLGAYVLSRNAAIAVVILLGFLTLAGLLAARGFWGERNEAEEKLHSIEDTPGFKIDAVLKNALELRESLRHNLEGLDEREARIRTAALIVECVRVVNECAPAYVDDLNTKQLDNDAKLLDVISENYRVLATIRKQFAGAR